MEMTLNSQSAIQELYKAFNLLNTHFYNGELPEAYIIITSTLKQKAYGWFTPYKVWQDREGTVQKHEIAMSAEYMNRDWIEVIQTLHHEMIHLYCHTKGIQDTSRQNRYHNKNFKRECEAHGFYYEIEKPDETIGWSRAILKPETVEIIKGWDINHEAFSIARVKTGVAEAVGGKTTRPKAQSFLHKCPSCELQFRAQARLNVQCNDCNEDYIVEE